MARLIVTALAESDRRRILNYLVDHAGYAIAERYNQHFRSVLSRIADFPDSGAPRPVLGASIRIAVVDPYVVIYNRTKDGVAVIRIVHGKRDISRDMLSR
jgi:toxin ParE1/3/4